MIVALPVSRTIVLTDLGAAAFSAALAIYDGTAGSPTPTPTPTFSRQPSMSTDGTPMVDEIILLDFGTIDGDAIGTCQILRPNGSVVAVVTTTSYRLAEAGEIRLRVAARDTAGLYAETPLVTVAAAAASTISAPQVAWTNADRTKNPPSLEVYSLDGSVDKQTDSVEVQFGNGSSAGNAATYPLDQLVTNDDDALVVDQFNGLPAGYDFTPAVRFTRPDGTKSPWGYPDPTHAVLAAPTAAPATTTWGTANNEHGYVGSWSDDHRDYRIPGTGADVWIVSAPARLIDKPRYAEIIFPAGDNVTRYFGAVDDAYVQAGKIQQFGPDPFGNRDPLLCAVQGPGGYMAYDSYQGGAVGTCPQFNVGDVLGVLAVPIKDANGAIVGSRITLSVNGVAGQPSDTPILNSRLMAACRADSHVLLNCGQEPFAHLPANANQWG